MGEKRQDGTVRWFGACLPQGRYRGWGFIEPHEGEEDVFVHYKDVPPEPDGWQTLYRNEVVEFDIEETDKGPKAVNVTIVEESKRRLKRRERIAAEAEEETGDGDGCACGGACACDETANEEEGEDAES